MLRFVRSHSGMTLINVIFLFVVVGVLVAAGAAMVGPLINRGKINKTKSSINSGVDAILSWSAGSGRLPTGAEVQSILPSVYDSWGTPLAYVYDNNLSVAANGGLCGRTATGINYGGPTNYVAFMLMSGGDDFTISSTPSSAGAYIGTLDPKTEDLTRIVTLEELKARAGCAGTTAGKLRIVNNELPKACLNVAYSATIFAEGGVPFTGPNGYEWWIQNLPAGVTVNPPTATSGFVKTPNLVLSGIPTVLGTVTVSVRDNHAPQNVIQRTLPIDGAANCNSFANFIIGKSPPNPKVTFVYNPATATFTITTTKGTDAGCSWFNIPQAITAGKTLRIYFEFVDDAETDEDNSGDFGNGFAFALYNSTAGTPAGVCGSSGALGYDGIANDTIAVELDTYKDNTNDPIVSGGSRNHIAAMVNSANHGATDCQVLPQPVPPVCAYQSGTDLNAVRWFENGVKHKVRIDIDSTGLLKAWLDCTDCNNPGQATIQRTVSVPAGFYYGFTAASQGARNQSTQITNFSASYY